MPKLGNGSKGDSNPGSLDCESGILPLSYRAPRKLLLLYEMLMCEGDRGRIEGVREGVMKGGMKGGMMGGRVGGMEGGGREG